MTDRLILPPREKRIHEGEWHLFCAGEGCSARLAVRQCRSEKCTAKFPTTERHNEVCKGVLVTELERGYIQEPNARFPEWVWWREEIRRSPLPRGRNVRKATRRALREQRETPVERNPNFRGQGFSTDQRLWANSWPYKDQILARFSHPKADAEGAEDLLKTYTTLRHLKHSRFRTGVAPQLGDNIVACYECGGWAAIHEPD